MPYGRALTTLYEKVFFKMGLQKTESVEAGLALSKLISHQDALQQKPEAGCLRCPNAHIQNIRLISISIGLILLVFFGMFVVSCDEVEHYKTLSFFFDGVPPPTQEGLQEEHVNANFQESAQTSPKQLWYVHEPQKDCTLCHGRRRQQRGFSLQVRLTAPVPKLCYGCHADYTVSAPFVHGPVAVGQCLFCHNPHKSKIEHLLKEPEPKLCYLCHDINTIELIPAHFKNQQFACTGCHNAHASPVKALLKGASSQTIDELDRTKTLSKAIQEHMQAAKEQHTTEQERKSLLQVFGTVSKLVEQGEIQKARAYLEKFKDSSAFTDEERRKIIQVLKLMEIAISTTEGGLEKVKQEKPVTEEKPKEPPAEPEKSNNQPSKRTKEIAELYYRSMELYHAGQLIRAREGFMKVLKSGLAPAPIAKTIRGYLVDIDNTLARRAKPPNSER
jgi:predicted CXXCH cytochrome family protein